MKISAALRQTAPFLAIVLFAHTVQSRYEIFTEVTESIDNALSSLINQVTEARASAEKVNKKNTLNNAFTEAERVKNAAKDKYEALKIDLNEHLNAVLDANEIIFNRLDGQRNLQYKLALEKANAAAAQSQPLLDLLPVDAARTEAQQAKSQVDQLYFSLWKAREEFQSIILADQKARNALEKAKNDIMSNPDATEEQKKEANDSYQKEFNDAQRTLKSQLKPAGIAWLNARIEVDMIGATTLAQKALILQLTKLQNVEAKAANDARTGNMQVFANSAEIQAALDAYISSSNEAITKANALATDAARKQADVQKSASDYLAAEDAAVNAQLAYKEEVSLSDNYRQKADGIQEIVARVEATRNFWRDNGN